MTRDSRQRRAIRSALSLRGYPKDGIDLRYVPGHWEVDCHRPDGRTVLHVTSETAHGLQVALMDAPPYAEDMEAEEIVVSEQSMTGDGVVVVHHHPHHAGALTT